MNIFDTKDFGKMIRAKRKALGYTQAYVAEFTGFSTSFLSDLERGKETVELGKAIYLANMLGLDLTLTERDGEE
ncbi:MAG: helix-turn-helix domain-containing protein [Lachnospiraceae bacterium]|nr:helix-turn-helix domain-containing protein [Lachnospiraceae bacterium]